MRKRAQANDDIAQIAYNLYIRRGKIPEYSIKDWIEAEKIVMKRQRRSNGRDTEAVSSAKIEKAKTG